MKRFASILVLGAVTAIALVRVASIGGRRGAAPPLPAGAVLRPAPVMAPVTDPAAAVPSGALGPQVLAAARERAPVEPLEGSLEESRPGSAALLSWTLLPGELERVQYIHSLDFDRLRALTVSTTSNAAGRFRFPAVPDGAARGDSVVWITESGREARAVLFGPADAWHWPAGEPAAARAPVRVVVRRAGAPVAGARLRHTLSFWETGQPEAERRPRRVFLREALTDAEGAATIVPGSGENALLALEGAERSTLWIGAPEGELELDLLPTITVEGHLTSDDPMLAFDDVRYSVYAYSASDRSDLVPLRGSFGVRPDGSFGPDPFARFPATRLWIFVSGGEIVAAQADVVNPRPGGAARVELHTRRGHPFELVVEDADGKPLEAATIDVQHWTESATAPLRSETTDAAGRAVLRAPQGQLLVRIRKPGFTSVDVQDERAFVPRGGPLAVVLRPAGVVTGFVHHASGPVQRFTVAAWTDDRSYAPEIPFVDEEGAFRLEDVPKGEPVHLFAFSDRLPQSETEVIVLGEEPREVVLELPPPRRARGRVVDSLTREPVAAATIAHLTTGMDGLAGFRGTAMPVQPDGAFELDGFFPGRGGFAVSAEGYETLYYHTREDEAEVIDAGLLVLHPLAVLDVAVREAGVADFGAYRAWNRKNHAYVPLPLSSAGAVSIPSRSGPYEVNVERPDGAVTWVSGIVLPGETRRVEVDLGGGIGGSIGGSIELAVVVPEPRRETESWTVLAFARTRGEERCVEGRWSTERASFLLRGLCAGDAVLELRDGADGLVCQRSVALTDAAHQTFTLEPGGEERRLRLVDARGRPWSSRPVVVSLPDASGWFARRETDANGEIAIGPLEEGRVVLSAKLAGESIAYGVAVDLEPDPARVTSVVLDVGPRSLLVLMEEGRPCGGVSIAFKHDGGPRYLEFTYSSDDDGLVRGPFLGPGVYTVRVNHKLYWPTQYPVSSADSTTPLPLELFSRSTLEIVVTTLAGTPIEGAELALEHVELGQSVAEWRDAGSIEMPDGLFTDPEGKVVLGSVPRGTYSWTCTSPTGAVASGTTRLAPRARHVLPIRIEER